MQTLVSEGGGSQSVDRASALLSFVARAGGCNVPMTALTAESGLSRPTVRRLMLALIRAGLVEQNQKTRHYSLGTESYLIGLMAQRRFDLLDCAMDSLLALSAESEDSSFLSIRRGSYAVCLHREEGAYPIRTQALQAGYRHPLGVGAGAMAILAALPATEQADTRADIAKTLEATYPSYTPEVIDRSIADTQRLGWSLNPGLHLINSWAVGVAVYSPNGAVLGALSIAALDVRMGPERQRELAQILRREAGLFEDRLLKKLGLSVARQANQENTT
jgi:DNA-binding IclR family transcriptional regulator